MKKYLIILRKKRFYVFLGSVILFIVIALFINNNGIANLDNLGTKVALFLRKYAFLYSIFVIITTLGSAYFLIPLSILLLLIFKHHKMSIYISLNLLCSWLLNIFLKSIFMRKRPDIMLIDEIGFSFPSGHATVSLAFYGFIIYLIYLKMKSKWKYLYISSLSLLIILIGVSRLYFGVHYLSDILGGYLLSLAYLVIFISIYNLSMRKQ